VSLPPHSSPNRPAARGTLAAAGAMVLFLAWLLLPLTSGRLFRPPGGAAPSAREAVPRPVRGGRPLSDYLHDFAVYFEKSNWLRPPLVSRYMGFKLHTLHISAVSSVVVGQGGWLFLGQENATVNELHFFLGLDLLTEETLARWQQVLCERRDWLARRGIAYLLVVSPNKSTVYPEFMPPLYPRHRTTRMDQLAEHLGRHVGGFPLLDLRPVLRAVKGGRTLYWPTDTHWNDFGKYLAYREIVRRLAPLAPALRPLPEEAFAVQPAVELRHDLEDLLLLPWQAPGPFLSLVPKQPAPLTVEGDPGNGWVHTRCDSGVLNHVLVVHDSFGDTLKLFLAPHFRECDWLLDRGHPFPAGMIERVRPRVVIDQITERYLEAPPWDNPRQLRQPTL